MKKILLVALVLLGLTGCYKDDLMLPVQEVNNNKIK